MDFNLVMPTTLDSLHLLLGVNCLVLLIFAIVLGFRKKAVSPEPVESPEPISEVEPDKKASKDSPTLVASKPDSAMQVLGLLQQEARFVDFLKEDLTGFSDQEIGAVARVVHEGGKKMLDQYFALEPVRSEEEESRVTLQPGFNSSENRITGNVVGNPPFNGVLVHRGWKVVKVDLPKIADGHDTRVIAPAEVEL